MMPSLYSAPVNIRWPVIFGVVVTIIIIVTVTSLLAWHFDDSDSSLASHIRDFRSTISIVGFISVILAAVVSIALGRR